MDEMVDDYLDKTGETPDGQLVYDKKMRDGALYLNREAVKTNEGTLYTKRRLSSTWLAIFVNHHGQMMFWPRQ